MSLGLPVLAFAQNIGSGSYFGTLMTQAGELLQAILIFLIALAVVWFTWNVVRYTMSSEEDGKEKAKSQMVHGIIAIAVIVSIWGIVALLRITFGVENGAIPSDIGNMIPGGDYGSYDSYGNTGSTGQPSYSGGGDTGNTTYDRSGFNDSTWNDGAAGYNSSDTYGDPSTDPSQGGLNVNSENRTF